MRKLLAGIGVVLAAIMVAACGASISSGTVKGKDYTPGRWETVMVPHYATYCSSTRSYSKRSSYTVRTCTSRYTRSTPSLRHVPATCELRIKNSTQDGWVWVDAGDCLTYRVGDHWHQ
jgi:hypothetical protein